MEMESVEENTQAKSPMEGDHLVSKEGDDDPEANPLHPQEVDVAGHRILKPTVKSLVTAYETHTLRGKKQVAEHISEEEWRLIRDTKIQASGKWLTRDMKDGSSPQSTPRSLQRRGTNPPGMGRWPDRITAGAVASASGTSTTPRTRGFTLNSGDSAVSQSSNDLTATWDKVPLRGSKGQQKAKKPDGDGQAAARVGAEKAEEGDDEGADDEDDDEDEKDARFRATKTWSAGTKLVARPVSIKVSPASTFDEWMLQSREDTQAIGSIESAAARPSEPALLSPHAPAAGGSDDEPDADSDVIITPRGTKKRRKSLGGGSDQEGSGKKKERMRKAKSNSSGRERKKVEGKSEKGERSEKSKKAKAKNKTKTDGEGKKGETATKHHKRRKSREKVEAAIVAKSGDDEEDSAFVSPPHSPHKRNAGSTPGPVRLVYEEGRGGNTNFTKINRKRSLTCNLEAEDTKTIHFSRNRKSAEIARSALAPLNLPIIVASHEPQEIDDPTLVTDASSGGATLSAGTAAAVEPISPAVPSRGRNAWASLLSKVSGWSGDKELRASRREERRRSKNVAKQAHQEFNRQGSTGSGLTVIRNNREIGRGGGGGGATLDISSSGERRRGRSWGKYEGKMVSREKRDEDETQHTHTQGKIDPAAYKRKGRDKRAVQRVLPRSLSFDSASSIGGDSQDEEQPPVGSGSPSTQQVQVMTEKMKNERDQEIASLEKQMRDGEGSGDFARDRINFELVHRSSYQGTANSHLRDLVHRGIVKEWNEERSPLGRLSKSARRRSCSGIAGHHPHRVLHDPFGDDDYGESSDGDQPSEDDEVQQVYDDLILTDETNSWHAERGSDSDFVMGAFPALEDDLHYTLMYKKYFYDKDHTNLCASTPEFGPVIISIEDKTSLRDLSTHVAGKEKRASESLISNFNINQTIQYFENMEKEQQHQQPTTPRGQQQQHPNTARQVSNVQPREKVPLSSQSMSMPAVAHGEPWSTRPSPRRPSMPVNSVTGSTSSSHSSSASTSTSPLGLSAPATPSMSLSSSKSAPGLGLSQSAVAPRSADKPRASRVNASLRFMKFHPDGAQEGSTESSPEAARGERGREESPPAHAHAPQRRVQPERLTSHSSMFLNRLGLSSETRLEVYRVLIQTRKGARLLFIRSGSRIKDKLKALKVACGVMGYLPEIQSMKFKAVTADIRDELLKLERSFNSQNYKFGVLYCKKGQTENEMFTNVIDDSNKSFERFLNFLGERITLKGWKNYTGGLDVKNESTGDESVYTEFREQRIMFHVSTLLPYYPRDEQQVERKRHLGNDIVVIVFLEPGAQFTPRLMTTQFNHIYCVVQMVEADSDVPAVRVEYAAKAGVRPFGPKLPSSTPFLLDDNFREFFFTKLINGERAALCAPVFAVKLENTRRALMNELVSRITPTGKSK